MKIKLKEITIRDLVKGYEDNGESGVVGYGGRLNIRPPYQREFIYKPEQRDAVIDSVKKGLPINTMYWSDDGNGHYEIIDGQQRTISVARFASGHFTFRDLFIHNFPKDVREKFLDYKIMVYFCSGTDSEKLEWFKIINIAGEKLTAQELRNAVYHGTWVTDAKRYFSRGNCAAYNVGNKYVTAVAIRQEYLETAIRWISGGNIEEYMGRHQHNADAEALWEYFLTVIKWVESVFTTYRKEMKGVDWGGLYNKHKKQKWDAKKLEATVSKLMEDEDVTSKKGIYTYVLGGEERYLSIRAFTEKQKRQAYERQKGICPLCKGEFEAAEMEADHKKPWSRGGQTIDRNCQMLCRDCNRQKAGR